MRLFISYAHVDWQFVQNLARRLERYHDVWFDHRLHAGTDWWETILEQLNWCGCFIYVLSPESLESNYCLDEYAEAKRLDRVIVPVRLQSNITLPDVLARVQYADFTSRIFEDALADLIGDLAVLERQLEHKARSKKSPVKAPLSLAPGEFDAVSIFREAVDARSNDKHETAIRLLNTLQQKAPDFLPEHHIAAMINDSTQKLDEQSRQKEYHRLYQQIGLLALDSLTVEDARQMWLKLQADHPDIDHDPDDLANKLSEVDTEPTTDLFKEGGWQSEYLSYTLPILGIPKLEPPQLEEKDTLSFNWKPIDGASHYVLEVAWDEDFTDTTVNRFDEPKASFYLPTDALYYFRVRACQDMDQGNPSNVISFDASQMAVPLLWPLDPVKAHTIFEVLWTGAPGAVYYELQESRDGMFNTDKTRSIRVFHPSQRTAIAPYPVGQYCYRVRAVDEMNKPSGWSNVITVEVVD